MNLSLHVIVTHYPRLGVWVWRPTQPDGRMGAAIDPTGYPTLADALDAAKEFFGPEQEWTGEGDVEVREVFSRPPRPPGPRAEALRSKPRRVIRDPRGLN